MLKRHNALKKFMLLLIALVFIGLILSYLQNLLGSPHEAAQKVRALGMIGPLVLIATITLEVIIAPMPGLFASIASGFAFGAFWGSLYSYIGNLLGALIVFKISKHFGRPLIKRLVKEDKLRTYDLIFHKKGKHFLWLAYAIPILPIDIISYTVGLSKMRFKEFFLIISIALVPYNFILGYFGSTLYDMETKLSVMIALMLITVIAAGFIIYHGFAKRSRNKTA